MKLNMAGILGKYNIEEPSDFCVRDSSLMMVPFNPRGEEGQHVHYSSQLYIYIYIQCI